MTPHLDSSTRAASTSTSRRTRLLHRGLAISSAMLSVGLLVAACDDVSSHAGGPAAPDAPSASVADAFDHVGPQQGDTAGVVAVMTAWDAAWNAGDAAGLAATFVDDAEFINAMGRLFVGADQIRAQHEITLAAQFRGSHTVGHVRRITFLSGTAAVLDVDNDLTRYEPVAPGSTTLRAIQQSGRHKRLVVKRGGEWRVMLFQNTMVAPPTP